VFLYFCAKFAERYEFMFDCENVELLFCFILLKYYLAEAIINMIAAITIINSSMPRRWFLGKYNSLRIINNINVADLLQH